MLKELLDRIYERAHESAKPKVIETPDETARYALFVPGKGVEWHAVPPPAREHEAYSIDALIGYAQSSEAAQVCWYTRAGATLVLDDETRRDLVTFATVPNDQWKMIETISQSARWTQPNFVRHLRLKYGDILNSSNLIDIVRKVKLKQLADQEVEIQQTQDAGFQLGARLVVVKVEAIDGRFRLQTGEFETTFDGTLVSALELAIDQRFQTLRQAEISGRSLSQHRLQMVAHGRQIQLLQFLL